jgi:hypothetical protein
MKEKIEDMKKQAKYHFESLQNLFEDRVQMLRETERSSKVKSESDRKQYRCTTTTTNTHINVLLWL